MRVPSIIDGYAELSDLREGMPIIEGIAQGPMINFDSGNGVPVTAPARLIALTEYLESIQSPAPLSYVP